MSRSLFYRLRGLWAAGRRAHETAESGATLSPAGPPADVEQPARAELQSPARWGDILRVQALTVSLLSKQASPSQLFRHIVDGAADSLRADEATLMLLEGDELRVVSACELRADAGVRRQSVRLGEGVAGLVAETGTAILLNEGDDLSRFAHLIPKGGRIQSALSVPLEVAGRVVGVLNANRLAGGERFSEEDLAVLRVFADTAALAIDQTNLLQRAQARSRALDTILSIAEGLAGGVEPPEALRAVIPKLGAALQPARAFAFFGTPHDGALSAVAGWSPATGVTGADTLGVSGLRITPEVARAFERREPTWIGSECLETVPGSPDAFPPRRLVVTVVGTEARARGALVLGWDEADFVLSVEDTRVLEGLVRQIELALSRQDRAALAGELEAQMAQARAHLMEVERLATIGQSMAGLVHDVNAPLTALFTLAQLIQKDAADAKSRERAALIIEAARRAQRLVREFLTMATPRPPTSETVDLTGLLKSAMDLERHQCSVAAIRLVADFEPDLPGVTADPHRLGQVFVNLLVNARQAMEAAEKGNAITVRTRRRDRTVEIHVSDNGPGIPSAVRPKVFDWFFTTKPPGEGTGLGLAVSREIMLANGGNLRVEDTPGGGATFVLELPWGSQDLVRELNA